MLDRIVNFLTSIRLTVVLLCAAILLVFIGTLAQVHEGLYDAQTRYFRSWFVWKPVIAHRTWPLLLPGGYLLGTLLLANLIAAHARRFKFEKRKIGILLIHGGLILLLVGQLGTDMFQVETQMRLGEGQSKNYSESSTQNELVLVDKTDPDMDKIVAIPQALLVKGAEIPVPGLPLTARVKEFFPNSEPRVRPPAASGEPPQASNGIANRFRFVSTSITRSMDDKNIPSAVVEISGADPSAGSWLVSSWATEEALLAFLQHQWNTQAGEGMGDRLVQQLAEPQVFESGGRKYEIALRPVRHYVPQEIQLIDFRHDRYRGTDIPKNFSSLVRLRNPATGEDREVKIYMNNPLRYAGLTYYQASFDRIDPDVTVLQVVRNPGWLTPYLACVLMSLGLLIQFMTHLLKFARKTKAA